MKMSDRGDDPDAVHHCSDMVNPKNVGLGDKSADKTDDRPGITILRVGKTQDITDDRLPGNRQENG